MGIRTRHTHRHTPIHSKLDKTKRHLLQTKPHGRRQNRHRRRSHHRTRSRQSHQPLLARPHLAPHRTPKTQTPTRRRHQHRSTTNPRPTKTKSRTQTKTTRQKPHPLRRTPTPTRIPTSRNLGMDQPRRRMGTSRPMGRQRNSPLPSPQTPHTTHQSPFR